MIYIQISQKQKNTVGNITKCRILDIKKKQQQQSRSSTISLSKIDITTVLNLKLLSLNCKKKSQMPLRYFQIYLTFQHYGSCMIDTT